MVDIFGDKEMKELIARIDAGPSAGIVDQSNPGQVAHPRKNTKSDYEKKMGLMNKLLGDILLKQYMAETQEDWNLVGELKIQADAMILKINDM